MWIDSGFAERIALRSEAGTCLEKLLEGAFCSATTVEEAFETGGFYESLADTLPAAVSWGTSGARAKFVLSLLDLRSKFVC